jgi:ribonuclease P protein subunit RPR2
MKRPHKRKANKFTKIANVRILELFRQAELRYHEDKTLSNRYVEIARKIAMKFKIKIPRELKRKYCKHCYEYLVHGDNCRVRINESKVVYTCFNCKKYMRFPVKPLTSAKGKNSHLNP